MSFLKGKTALITGAGRRVLADGRSGSIGYGIATAYAKEGANLVITGRNMQKLLDAKEELERLYGIQVLPIQADVNKETDNDAMVAEVIRQAVEKFGGIDVLINNAQASASGVTIADHTTQQLDLAMYSGLYAAFYYMKHAYHILRKARVLLSTLLPAQAFSATSARAPMQQPKKPSAVSHVWPQQNGHRMV